MKFEQNGVSSEILQQDNRLIMSGRHENRFAKPIIKKNSEGAK